MRKHISLRDRLFLCLLLLAGAVFPLGARAVTVEEVTSEIRYDLQERDSARYCFDLAGLLSPETERELVSEGRELYEAGSGQILLVTVEDLDGAGQAAFGTELFNELALGDAEADDGVLIMLIQEGNHCQIVTGDGIADILTDRRCGAILDEFCVPYLKDGDYDSAAKGTYAACAERLRDGEPEETDWNFTRRDLPAFIFGGLFALWLLLFPLGCICWLLDKITFLFLRIFRGSWPEETIFGAFAETCFALFSFGSDGGGGSGGGGGYSSGGGGSSSGGGAER